MSGSHWEVGCLSLDPHIFIFLRCWQVVGPRDRKNGYGYWCNRFSWLSSSEERTMRLSGNCICNSINLRIARQSIRRRKGSNLQNNIYHILVCTHRLFRQALGSCMLGSWFEGNEGLARLLWQCAQLYLMNVDYKMALHLEADSLRVCETFVQTFKGTW